MANNSLANKSIPQYPEIKNILSDFEKTDLTVEEAKHLSNLNDNYAELKTLEADRTNSDGHKEEIVSVLHSISANLDNLAEVQLSEGRQLTQRSKRSLGMNRMLSSLEIVFLVIIGILFLIIVFHKDKPDMELVEEKS